MPYTAAGRHPFEAARVKDARLARGVSIGEVPVEQRGVRGQARVRVVCHAVAGVVHLEVVEEHKGLHQFAKIAGAHEPGDGTSGVPLGAVNDLAGLKRCLH